MSSTPTVTTPVEKLDPNAAWRHPDFVLFQSSRIFSIVASQMTGVVVGAQIYNMTGNPLDLGFIGLSLFLPMFGLSPVTGFVADRYDRRNVVSICQLGIFVSASLLCLLSIMRVSTPYPIFAVLVLQGISRAFWGPSAQGLLPLLVPQKTLQNAIVWNSTIFQFGTIVGPGIGGLMLTLTSTTTRDHPEIVYGIAAVMMLGAAFCVRKMKIRAGALEKEAISWSTLVAGVKFIFDRKIVLGAMSLDLFAVLLAGATALMPAFAKDILGVGSWGLGILRGSMGIGAGVTALAMAFAPPLKNPGRLMFVCVAGFGACTVLFGLSKIFALSVAALVLMGVFDMISVVIRQTLVQTLTPRSVLGRVNAVNLIFIGASNELGEFESGITAHWFGTVPSVVIGGVGSIIITFIWAWLFPSLRNYSGKEEATEGNAPTETQKAINEVEKKLPTSAG